MSSSRSLDRYADHELHVKCLNNRWNVVRGHEGVVISGQIGSRDAKLPMASPMRLPGDPDPDKDDDYNKNRSALLMLKVDSEDHSKVIELCENITAKFCEYNDENKSHKKFNPVRSPYNAETDQIAIRVPPDSLIYDEEGAVVNHELLAEKGFWVTAQLKVGSLYRGSYSTDGKTKYVSSWTLRLESAVVHEMDDEENKDFGEPANKRMKFEDFA